MRFLFVSISCAALLICAPLCFAEDSRAETQAVPGVKFSADGTVLVKFPHYHVGSYTIPPGVTKIGDFAFVDCIRLTAVTIPDTIVSIGTGAFRDCSALTSITIPESVLEVGDFAFSNCSTVSLVIPGKGVRIGKNVAYGCSALVITDMRYAASIGRDAFRRCTSLEHVALPETADYANLGISRRAKVTLYTDTGNRAVSLSYGNLWWVDPLEGLCLRDAPGLEGKRLDLLPFGTAVDVLEAGMETHTIDGIVGRWMRVRTEKGEGFIFGGYLSDRPTALADASHRLFVRERVRYMPVPAGKTLRRDEIVGSWYVVYANGEPVSADQSGNLDYDDFMANTGMTDTAFVFLTGGTCGSGRPHSGAFFGGRYSLSGSTVKCEFEFYPEGDIIDGDEATSYIHETYELVRVDRTHLQIRCIERNTWYLCALKIEEFHYLLREPTCDGFKEFVLSNWYENCAFASEETLLMMAVCESNVDAVTWLIKDRAADVNRKNLYGMTALHYAMRYPHDDRSLSIIRLLLESGVSPNAIDDYGQTPLDYSIYSGYRPEKCREARALLAAAGGKSSRNEWALKMAEEDFPQ